MTEATPMKVRWDPDQYHRFASQRLRPALELMARLQGHPWPAAEPRIVYDLGCGTGEITRILSATWPAAQVHGIDSSESMLEKARAADVGSPSCAVTFELGDLATWTAPTPADLLYSNAAYHWIPDHRAVFPRLLRSLAPGGALAVQMPMSWDLPSHRAMRETLELGRSAPSSAPRSKAPEGVVLTTPVGAPFGPRALRDAMNRKPLLETAEYYDVLRENGAEVDLWETEYLQALEGEDAVLEWVSGTGLRPILDGLEGEERDAFLDRYRGRLRELYPRRADGRTLYPFRRLFLYARV
jgi:trans-aconitate 2-methyltransferase